MADVYEQLTGIRELDEELKHKQFQEFVQAVQRQQEDPISGQRLDCYDGA